MFTGGLVGIGVEEGRFDEEDIHAPGQGENRPGVGGAVNGVGNVGDLPARSDPDDLFHQFPQGRLSFPLHPPRLLPPDQHGEIRRAVVDETVLEIVQPGSRGKPQFGKGVFADVDPAPLFQAEGQAGRPVIQKSPPEAEITVGTQEAVKGPLFPFPLRPEAVAAGKTPGPLPALRTHLRNDNIEIINIFLHQVPVVRP